MVRVDSVTRSAYRLSQWSAGSSGLAWLFAAGLVVRLVLSFSQGFPFDIATFSAWADRLATGGLRAFYADPEYFVDYPPGYLYVLWVLGGLSRLLTGGAPGAFLLKMPAVAADLALAWVVVALTRRVTPGWASNRFRWEGIAAAAILLNPAIFFISAVWGQVESVQALLVAAGFLLLSGSRPGMQRETAGVVLLTVAVLTKPQAVFVLPVAALVLLWRHVWPSLTGGRDLAAAGIGVLRLAGMGVVASGAGILLLAPFGLGIPEWFHFFRESGGTYPYTSVWAFNLWGVVGFWQPDSGEDAFRVLGVPAFVVGLALFAAGGLAVLARAARALSLGEMSERVLLLGGAAMTLVPFAVMTRIHERYLYLALACLAPFVAYRWVRRSLVALSALYYLNTYFAYAFYIDYVDSSTLKADWLFNLVYGVAQDSLQRKVLSLATGAACLAVAWIGWTWLRQRDAVQAPGGPVSGPPIPGGRGRTPVPATGGGESEGFRLRLHPIGRRGAALGALVLVVVGISRFAGLSTPTAMYFDEVYHARTGGEYLEGRDVYEWTHPPLPKQIMAVSIALLSGFRSTDGGPAPDSLRDPVMAADTDSRLVWAAAGDDVPGLVLTGTVLSACGIDADGQPVVIDVVPTAVAAAPGGAIVGGTGADTAAVMRVSEGSVMWRAATGEAPVSLAFADGHAFAVTAGGTLMAISPAGEVLEIAAGAHAVVAAGELESAWASFPDEGHVGLYGVDGILRAQVPMQGSPGVLAVSQDSGRILVADVAGTGVASIDNEARTASLSLEDFHADHLAAVPGSALVWAAQGSTLRVVEPRGMSRIASVHLDGEVLALADDTALGVVAITDAGGGRIECASGSPQRAWRLGSAVMGAAMAALAALIAIRLFGSLAVGALAALFVAVDGLALTLSRIAMNDAYVTAFVLASWLCLLSAFFHWGYGLRDGERSRLVAVGWLSGSGVFLGGAIASKWVGVYAVAGLGMMFVYDLWARRERGMLSIAGHPVASLAVLAALFAAVPLGLYVATYIPYFALGHGPGDLLRLQQSMFSYHAGLDATHPYGSPWYGWPFGRRSVFVFVDRAGTSTAEIWLAGNPVVLVGGLVGLGALSVVAWSRRSAALAIAPLAAAVQFLPWTLVGRVTFLYHYLPLVPFLAIGLAWWIVAGREGVPSRQRAIEVGVVVSASVAVFAFMLPILAGWYVSDGYISTVKTWLGWMFS